MNKICDFAQLAEKIESLKSAGKKIVLCHGVFDLLHIGHIRYLRRAKEFGDVLVVTLTPDAYVDKGPGRPVFISALRAESLASLGVVDYVAINQWPTAENTLRALKPDFYVKGAEFKNLGDDPTGKIQKEAAAAEEAATKMVFIDDLVFSSSSLINQHFSIYSEDLAQYLDLIRSRYDLDDALAYVDRMRELKVLVIGETIIDQYAYCSPLGLSSKDPTMAVRQLSEECFPGGAMAVARHAAGLAGEVAVYTLTGENCPYLEMISKDLPPNLELLYDTLPNAPSIRKLRYVDNYSLAKLLEIYHVSMEPLPESLAAAMLERLSAMVDDFDVVMAADFGHGLFTDKLIEMLASKARFLAVNTQANAGNRGYHTIWRYPRADFISLARHELNLAFQDRHSPDLLLMSELMKKRNPKTLVVTCGSDGLKSLAAEGYVLTPALSSVKAVDRVGAGDALFTAAALAAKLDCPLDLLGLIGNIAGAKLVESVGNSAVVDAGSLKKALTAMLK